MGQQTRFLYLTNMLCISSEARDLTFSPSLHLHSLQLRLGQVCAYAQTCLSFYCSLMCKYQNFTKILCIQGWKILKISTGPSCPYVLVAMTSGHMDFSSPVIGPFMNIFTSLSCWISYILHSSLIFIKSVT